MVRILLADDQPQMRRGLRMSLALEPDFEVVGEAEDGSIVLPLASTLRPDVVILDVDPPGRDILTLTKALSTAALPCAVIILSIHDDPDSVACFYAAGAVAFVSKRESPTRLIIAIRHSVGDSSPNHGDGMTGR